MKHRLFTLFVLFAWMLAFLPAQPVQAETPASPRYASGDFVWAKSMGGTDLDSSRGIAVDSNGNVYTTGSFSGTADFDPGAGTFNLTSAGLSDIFVSKLDSSGNFVWAKNMGGADDEEGYSIAIDSNGNVYTTGYFNGTADFDPGAGTFNLTSAGSYDIFVSKLDSGGNFVWARRMGGTWDDNGRGIAVDSNGNVYTTGSFALTADFDPGAGTFNLTSAGGYEIFVSKLDSSGNFVWAKSMGGTDYDEGRSIAVDSNGNVYTTGYFWGTADFDPGAGTFNLTSAGGNDIFVSKLDSSGNFVWAKQMGGTDYDYGHGIAVDSNGNVYTTGIFQGTADFDPGAGTFNLTSAGLYDIFVSKLDSSGNFLWAKSMGGTDQDIGHGIAVDSNGYVYTTGIFQGTADFDPGAGTFNLTSAAYNDIFVSRLDSSGNFVWARRMGGTYYDYGFGIAVDSSGVYTTGVFQGTVDFDPGAGTFNLTSAGSHDIFVSKLDKNETPANITVNSTADTSATDGACTLREAIQNADNNAATYADCAAGSANDTILFDSSLGTATITLASTLPTITDSAGLTIDGDHRITLSGNNSVQVLYVYVGALLTLQNISVTHGSATSGGGVSNSGTLTITHSTFSNNSAINDGGGVDNFGGTLIIANSTFLNNSANYGGGVENNSGTLSILNSTFSGNGASSSGGGVDTYQGGTTPPITTISNTILANSTAGGDCVNYATGTLYGGSNIIKSTTTCTSIATLTSDPMLGTLTGSPAYFPLNYGSPAIDAGDDAVCAAAPVSNTSQNGVTRPQGLHCEIGAFEYVAPTILSLTLKSSGAQDGWILESSETSNVGGTLDSAATTFRLGDDSAKKQYRSILSFSTGAGLPDNAIITKVTLKVKKQGITGGGNPVTMFQGFMLDIKKGTFGTAALQTSDFQTAASRTYGPFLTALSGGWYSIDLTPGKGYINKMSSLSGLTQIRLRFKLDDNNNTVANYLSLYSGNAPAASRPQLIIEYYVP